VCQPPHIVTSLYIILFIVSCFLVKKEHFCIFDIVHFFRKKYHSLNYSCIIHGMIHSVLLLFFSRYP
jgi:hypothetical protein